ncbi:ACP S-malonyltransferase [Cohnella silvisoli]|uniref:[acyl-carrier-protein] S-malonyltransferase n=1 Tax=Cohnella silvisoli TaxID=2873699 RepID=A0ABV1L4J4_9BACL|nr:ACP S-malonyltransferase [Cohnella silvisoli]MCD9026583.1 ACP S-malonyltransferase [Cohnella silvisoli]
MTKIGMLFPGQGSQFVGMGATLAERHAIARRTFEEASETLGWDVMKLCAEGDSARLTETANAQPAILTYSVAAYRVLSAEWGVRPALGAGHSLGEFSALACSGVLAFPDAVSLVRKRGEFMESAGGNANGAMAAVSGISDERLGELLSQTSIGDSVIVLAGINSAMQRVVSGDRAALERLTLLLTDLSVRVTPLNVGAAFHSPYMKKASERLREQLEQCQFRAPEWPVLSNVTGLPHDGRPESLVRLLTRQLTEPVRWLSCMQEMHATGIDRVIESGPGSVLSRLWKSFSPETKTAYSDDMQGITTLMDNHRMAGYSDFLPRCLGIASATRNNRDDPDAYRIGVLEPYREVEKMAREQAEAGSLPTEEQLRKGWSMLQSMFDTKGTETAERIARLVRLLEQTGTSHLFRVSESINGGVEI